MFRGAVFSGHGVVVVFNSNFPLEEGNIRMEYADCRYISFSKTFILVTYQWHQHSDATWKFWCIQVTGLIEHKVQLDVFQMLTVTVTVNNRSDWNRHEAVQDECHQLDMLEWIRLLISNGGRSVTLVGESSS